MFFQMESKDKYNFKVVVRLTGTKTDYVFKVLKPLEKEMFFSRARVEIKLTNNDLILEGLTRDITSLRSIVNGLLKSIYLALKIEDLSSGARTESKS